MEAESNELLVDELWQEHLAAPFPKSFRGKDVSGIDFVLLDANVAGCVSAFLKRGTLNLQQTAMLGLAYRDASYVLPLLNEEGAASFSFSVFPSDERVPPRFLVPAQR